MEPISPELCAPPAADAPCIIWNSEVPGDVNHVLLLLHGLNLKPEALSSLARIAEQQGYATGIVVLSGHTDQTADVSADIWRDQLRQAYCLTEKRYPGARVSLLGYSLGGALAVSFLDRYPEASIEKLLLIAPALGLRNSSQLFRLLSIIPFGSLSIPSFAPKDYRARSSTSLAAYRAVYELYDETYEIKHRERFSHLPILTALANHDELICNARVKRWAARNGVTQTKFIELRSDPKNGMLHHLIVDETCLGKDEWKKLKDEMIGFLSSS